MKRLSMVLFVFFTVFGLLPVSSLAANKVYYLKELGITIEIPSNYIVSTRDSIQRISADYPRLDMFWWTKDEIYSEMLKDNAYLSALDKDFNYALSIRMRNMPSVEDYNQLSDTEFKEMISTRTPLTKKQAEASGRTLIRVEPYQNDQSKFFKTYFSEPIDDEIIYELRYNTVYDGKAIDISLISFYGTITYEETILKQIVDSIRFDKAAQLNPSPTETKASQSTVPEIKDKENKDKAVKNEEVKDEEKTTATVLFLLICLFLISSCLFMHVFVYSKNKKIDEQKNPTNNAKIDEQPIKTMTEPSSNTLQAKVEQPVIQESSEEVEEVLSETDQREKNTSSAEVNQSAIQASSVKTDEALSLTKQPENTKAEGCSLSFCHRCGNKLISGSLFCSQCGIKLPAM